MPESQFHYLRLQPEAPLPAPPFKEPFRAVVVVREPVGNDWRNAVSDWLVASGCRYMLAWGHECSLWDDAVDWAYLDATKFEEAPPESFVMTTWHEEETVGDVMGFARSWANHPVLVLDETWILDIGDDDASAEARMREQWTNAGDDN